MNIVIFGSGYEFPAFSDEGLDRLKTELESTKESLEKGSRERVLLFGIKRPPSMSGPEQLALMERLVGGYDSLLSGLRGRMSDCRAAFGRVAEGVGRGFEEKLGELAALEEKRRRLVAGFEAQGRANLAESLKAEGERNRRMAASLTRASILILRKLKHALAALESLSSDEETQRRTLEGLRGTVEGYRELSAYLAEAARLQQEVESATKSALEFDQLLSQSLGPLALLVDEVTKVDLALAENAAEIQKLSVELEAGASFGGLGGGEDRLLALLSGARIRADKAGEVVAKLLEDEGRDQDDFSFALAEAEAGAQDFSGYAESMRLLVREGLSRLGGAPAAALPTPAQVAAIAAPAALEAPPAAPEAPAAATAPPAAPEAQPAAPEAPAAAEPPAWARLAEGLARGGPAAATAPEPAAPLTTSAYRAAISRAAPTLILFLIDRSGSMDERYTEGLSRADYLARTVDDCLYKLCVDSSRAEGIRDYFHVACLGYGDGSVGSALGGSLGEEPWVPISRLAAEPLELVADAEGQPRPRWIEARAKGDTPLREAFVLAARLVARWCEEHPGSYPPTVINISDGEGSDGDPLPAAGVLARLRTEDGETLVFNLHVGEGSGKPALFPDGPAGLTGHAARLFSMSSRFPPHLADKARSAGYPVAPDSRFFAYGAQAEVATRFLDLGTRPTRLA